ncbi:MAG: hypothetical protein ACD_58C00304G0013 [uncultured bacterium]|nr:MAG: hypothetical protein ACD_58C00304G0013 [uncultured bacterium]
MLESESSDEITDKMPEVDNIKREAEPVRPTPEQVIKAVEKDIPSEHLTPMIDLRPDHIGDFIGAVYQFMYDKHFDKLVNDDGMSEEEAAELADPHAQDYLDNKGLSWY